MDKILTQAENEAIALIHKLEAAFHHLIDNLDGDHEDVKDMVSDSSVALVNHIGAGDTGLTSEVVSQAAVRAAPVDLVAGAVNNPDTDHDERRNQRYGRNDRTMPLPGEPGNMQALQKGPEDPNSNPANNPVTAQPSDQDKARTAGPTVQVVNPAGNGNTTGEPTNTVGAPAPQAQAEGEGEPAGEGEEEVADEPTGDTEESEPDEDFDDESEAEKDGQKS